MTITRVIGSVSAACAAALLFAAPVSAHPHHGPRMKKVCKTEWHHHHKVRTCHTVRAW
jgi:hypothetical protein